MFNKEKLNELSIYDILEKTPKIFIEQFAKISFYYSEFIAMQSTDIKDRTEFINESYNAINLLMKLVATASNGKAIEEQVTFPTEARFPFSKRPSAQFGTEKDSISLEDYLAQTQVSSKDYEREGVITTAYNNGENIPHEDKTDISYTIATTDNTTSTTYTETTEDLATPAEIKYDDHLIETSSNHTEELETMNVESLLGEDNESTPPPEEHELTAIDIMKQELENWGIPENSFGYLAMVTMIRDCYNTTKVGDAFHIVANALNRPVASVASSIANIVRKANFKKTEFVPRLKKIDPDKVTKEFLVSEYLAFCDDEPINESEE